MSDEEVEARSRIMSILISNVKGNALKLLKRYQEPHECWSDLKFRYESDHGPRCHSLLDKLFNFKKTEGMTMDSYLVDIKNIVDMLEEIGCKLPEDAIVYCTIANLPREYTIFKRMYGGNELLSFRILESKLLSEEQAFAVELDDKGGEALSIEARHNNDRRPTGRFSAFPCDRGSERSYGHSGGSNLGYSNPTRPVNSSFNHDYSPNYSGSRNPGFHRSGNHTGSSSVGRAPQMPQ
jgi:hypothetical protein